MLRLVGAFVHSAPQCVFQLYILTRRNSFGGEDLMIAIAAITSLISVVWALVCYSKALRDLRDNARDLPWLGFTCQVLWRGCMITSRVVALVLFASHFKQWMLLAIAGHWMLMALWLSCQRTQFCIDENGREHPCKEKIFNSIIAFIYIFCFFNTKEGMTRKRIVLYYSVMLVENSLLISMWYPNRTLNSAMTYASLAIVWGGFVFGVIFMILYYRFYHHSHTFKGMFLRNRKFTLHGRKMYGLYFCCCFRIKRWELGLYDVSSDPQLLMSRGVDEENGGAGDMELEAFPRDNSQHGNLYWDHDDIRMQPLNGTCIKGRPNSPEREMLLQNAAQSSREDTEEVPDIVITAASPLVLSPRDSHSSLSDNPEHGGNSEMTCTCNDEGEPSSLPHSPDETPVEKAKRMLASKLHKNDEIKDEEISDGDEEIPKINYGSVSFGNRYSLVSSDCISLSSESSLSSFTNSLNDLLDRMGVSAKANQEPEHKDPKTSTGDEGIFSDERDSPAKSSTDKEVEPAPVTHQKDIKNRVKLSDSSANSETAMSPCSSQEEEEEDVIESIMDAPPSPHAPKKTSLPSVKDEGEESESTDVSSDGISNERDRRYSYDEMLIESLENKEEEINKRHSFDIAELTRKSKRAKKRGRNRKRHKIITFDNFVASPLKPCKFGSLRKSFERLSKIQEDHEEMGLLSDEVLPVIEEPPSQETLPSDDGVPISNGAERKESVINKPQSDEKELERPSNNNIDRGTTGVTSPPLWVKKDANRQRPLRNKTKQNFDSNDYKNDSLSLEETTDNSKVETTFFDEENTSPDEEPSDDSSDEVVLVEELSPSRFSTVRRSRESVPLACVDEVDDLDDLGTDSDIDSLRDAVERPRSVSPEADTPVAYTKPDIYATDSNDSESLQARSLNDFDSSGSSLFENLLYLEPEQATLDEHGRYNKRHTYDFGSDRIARQGKVKRLGTSSSHNAMRTPGSPVWVHKAIFKHRRRKPKPLAQTNVNKSDSAIGFIQEIRV